MCDSLPEVVVVLTAYLGSEGNCQISGEESCGDLLNTLSLPLAEKLQKLLYGKHQICPCSDILP